MKIFETNVQSRGRGGNDLGAIEPGNYTVENDTVTLTDVEGVPIASGRLAQGYTAKLGDEPHADVARRLIWRHYRARKGGSDFNRPLPYPATRGWR
jgi:hypothetical protein